MLGQIHLYTGNGKGKTTAALGLAFRAAAYGYKTYIGQFMKGQVYGEIEMARSLEWLTVEQFGSNTLVHVKHPPDQKNICLAKEGLDKSMRAMHSGDYDIIVLDEICVAHYYNLIELSDILEFIKQKPDNIELILTGRYADKEINDYVDLITNMEEVKHYYNKGIESREGIEK